MDPNDPNGPELEVRMDDLRANIRRSETSKAKYEARLECLRTSGAPVDEWLKEIDLLAVQDTLPRSSSLLSVRTDASGAAVILINDYTFYCVFVNINLHQLQNVIFKNNFATNNTYIALFKLNHALIKSGEIP